MAVRKCPYCLVTVPAGRVLAYSNDLECPGCRRPLEVSPVSRYLSIWVALAAGAAVWYRAARPASDEGLAWVAPVVYAFLAFSIVAPILLMLTGDLRLKSADAAQPSPATPDAHPGSSGSHH